MIKATSRIFALAFLVLGALGLVATTARADELSDAKAFIAKQVDFAGSDSALKTEAKDGKVEADDAKAACGSPAWNLPMVTGPIAIAYNVKGVDNLVLNADVAAKIFDGKIATWNYPAIASLNKGVTLPAIPIKVYFRSDESGTTENFTKYLKAAAPQALLVAD